MKKIVETGREYTKAYFMTNQTPSSKKKKDAQDEFEKEFNIEVVILNGEDAVNLKLPLPSHNDFVFITN